MADNGPPQPPLRRRVLRLAERDATDSATLAAVSPDDVLHAQQTARTVCTPLYRRYLSAGLDDTERTP